MLRPEDAARKFSSLPTQRMKLDHRGLLRPDYFADITIFDPAKVLDVATFENPKQPRVGIEYVFVNGVLSLEHGKVTGQLGGRPLRGPAWMKRDIVPEGQPPRGKVHGVITDEDGWPLPRTTVALINPAGKNLGIYQTKMDGRYEILAETACEHCRVTAERMGFVPQQRAVNYNGANSLWFSFALKRTD